MLSFSISYLQIFRHEWLHQFLPPNSDLFYSKNTYGRIPRSCKRWWHYLWLRVYRYDPLFTFKQYFTEGEQRIVSIMVNGRESWNDNPETTRMLLKYCWVSFCVDIHTNWVVWTKGNQSIAAECCQISPVKWVWPTIMLQIWQSFWGEIVQTLNIEFWWLQDPQWS